MFECMMVGIVCGFVAIIYKTFGVKTAWKN